METIAAPATTIGRRLIVQGIVQGVGFRPFVYRLATELGLEGWVRNDGGGVTIEVQGPGAFVEAFTRRLTNDAPPLARVDRVTHEAYAVKRSAEGFAIRDSDGDTGQATTAIGPDATVCDDCLAELFTRKDRRYRYAFINCTHCGPRYTITRALPYDRAQTSMARFAQCPACLAEYSSPLDRRFHAEPNACPVCGPQLALVDPGGRPLGDDDPIAATLMRLLRGEIVAIKGLGGYHLACDARSAAAVALLRERKAREEKPLAVMVANLASAQALVEMGDVDAALLNSRERPIVLLRKGAATDTALVGVAPGLAWLGVMLPYTPLQHLLFHEAAGRPPGSAWREAAQRLTLVMTSANPGGEPLVTGNDEALTRLAGIADAWLMHDRDIVIRCDDSVLRPVSGGGAASHQFVRRARGYTPRAIVLAAAGPSVVAVGGYFKNTVCVTRGDEAFVSEHVGDLDNAATCAALEDTVAHLVSILDVEPTAVAHDLHPDFFSTRLAARLAAQWQVPLQAVQHHHAHIAAIVAEHRVAGPVLGLALDGVGLGTDGTAWGGELLRVDGAHCDRLGRLRPLRLPGGDRAAREPWRMAAAALAAAGQGNRIVSRFADEPGAPTVVTLLERGLNAPETSSLGRWFDAVAGLLDVRRQAAFEGQAAMLLEGLAETHGPVAPDRSLFALNDANELDLLPLALHVADLDDPAYAAALFHATLAAALAEWATRAAKQTGLSVVACGGGCLLNAIVALHLRQAFDAAGLRMLEARAVPPNDGGLALGQAWVALQAIHSS